MHGKTDLGRIVLALHGDEPLTMGGPSIRVPHMARVMRSRDMDARVLRLPDAEIAAADLVHGFNVWNPESALAMARRVRRMGKPFVFSPIFLDLRDTDLWNRRLPSLFERTLDAEHLDEMIGEEVEAFGRDLTALREPLAGYHAMVRELIDLADHVICLSHVEKTALEAVGAVPRSCSIIRNPVAAEDFADADPSLFVERYGLRDFVLCVARVEPRKNQMMLLHALRNTSLPVVLVGDEPNPSYSALLDRYASDRVHRLGRLERGDGMLQSALAAARVVALPSWSEGAPLSALEAAASGAALVLSSKSGEAEYLGDHAHYCDPGDPVSIREAVLAAATRSQDKRQATQRFVQETYSWSRHVDETAGVYRQAILEQLSSPLPKIDTPRRPELFVAKADAEGQCSPAALGAEIRARRALESLGYRPVAMDAEETGNSSSFVFGTAGTDHRLVVVCGDTLPSRDVVEIARYYAEANDLKLSVLLSSSALEESDFVATQNPGSGVFQSLIIDADQIVCNSAALQSAVESLCMAEDILRPKIHLLADFGDEHGLADILQAATPSWSLDDICLAGAQLSLGREAPRRGLSLNPGWRVRDEMEVWSVDLLASLRLKLRSTGLSVLALSARMPVWGADVGVCAVDCNGVEIGRAIFADAALHTFAFTLPRPTDTGEVLIRLRVDRLRPEVPGGPPVGVALNAVAFEAAEAPFLSRQHQHVVLGKCYDLTHWDNGLLLAECAIQNGVWGMHNQQGLTRLVLPRGGTKGAGALRLHVRCRAVASMAKPLRASVLADGQQIGWLEASSDDVLNYEFGLPEGDPGDTHRVIDFVDADHRSPASLGIGESHHVFSVGLFNALLVRGGARDLPAIRRAGPISFGSDANVLVEDDELIPGEWHHRETLGRWSNGSSASVRLMAPASTLDAYLVTARLNLGSIATGLGGRVSMQVGGRTIARRHSVREETILLEGFVPASTVCNGMLDIRLSTGNSFTPWSDARTLDDRRLGFHLHEIAIRPSRRPGALSVLFRTLCREIFASRRA